MNLDSVLNFAIPAGVIIFLLASIFGKIREPLSAFWNWIRNLFGIGIEKIKEAPDQMDIRSGNITYR